jgi:hypothetical protein
MALPQKNGKESVAVYYFPLYKQATRGEEGTRVEWKPLASLDLVCVVFSKGVGLN